MPKARGRRPAVAGGLREENQAHVLVAEDSATQAEALSAALEDGGYRVTVAQSGDEALRMLGERAFDIVISDIVMPGPVDGYELCRRLKAGEQHDTPVMLLTNLSDPMDIIRGLEAGADNFLTKPYETSHLLDRLAVLLTTKRARTRRRVQAGVTVYFMGHEFTITSEREQILDLLVSTFEDAVRQNHELRAREEELERIRAKLADYAKLLEARLASVLASVPDALFSVSPDWREIYYASPAFERVFGCAPADLTLDHWRQWIHAEDLIGALAVVQRAVDERTAQTFGYRFQPPGQTLRWISETVIPAVDEAGRVVRLEGIARDATESRMLEEQLRQAQKMEAIGRLAGGVAHDFNNLLTVVLGESDMALADLPHDHPVRTGLEEIKKAGERAAVLTRQLLAFSRKQLVEPKVFDLNDLVGDVEKMLHRLIGEDIDLDVRTAPDLGLIKADRGQIEQVLVNLVVNARDAMPNGGKLTIKTATAPLDADYSHHDVVPGDYVVLMVSDTGIGMTKEVQSKIFEPFFTTKEGDKGTGLGLATSYGIVKQFGGHIGVYSEVGVGTTMKAYLPRVAEPADIARLARTVALPLGTETILLVEDDDRVRHTTARILRSLGYLVLDAADAAEAVELLGKHADPVHLLLTDVVLPKVGGRLLAERVAALRPGIKILFASGYTDDVILQHQLLEHNVALIQKPFTPESLARKVREVLDTGA